MLPYPYLYLNESIHLIYLCSNLWSWWWSSSYTVYNIFYKYYVPLHISLFFYHREYYMAYAHQNPVMSDALLRFTGEWNASFLQHHRTTKKKTTFYFLCFCWRCDGIVFCSKSMCVWCVWWWMECMHEYVEATHHVHHILHHHTNDKASRQDYTLLFLSGSLSLSLPFFSLFIALDSIFTSCNSKNEFLISSYIVRIIFFCGWE